MVMFFAGGPGRIAGFFIFALCLEAYLFLYPGLYASYALNMYVLYAGMHSFYMLKHIRFIH